MNEPRNRNRTTKNEKKMTRLEGVTKPTLERPVLVNLADIKPTHLEWLWPGRIPLKKLAILAGDPGLGKSLVSLSLAAAISQGRPVIEGEDTSLAPGGVVLLTNEDDMSDTVVPRLLAAKADRNRINWLNGYELHDSEKSKRVPFIDLRRHLEIVRQAIRSTENCKLLIIDTVNGYLPRTDTTKDNEVRLVLQPLTNLAEEEGITVLGIMHPRKARGPAIHSINGSIGFVGAARCVWMVCEDPHQDDRRLLLPVKNNLAESVSGLSFTVHPVQLDDSNSVPVVVWDPEPVIITADDIVGEESSESSPRFGEATCFLQRLLSDGPKASTKVYEAARSHGHQARTIRRASHALGIKKTKQGMKGGWLWTLPTEGGQSHEGGQDTGMGLGA